jgi:hypothetical protein
MQALCRLIFHRGAECITFDVIGNQWTEKDDRPSRSNDNAKNRNHCEADDYFRCKATTNLMMNVERRNPNQRRTTKPTRFFVVLPPASMLRHFFIPSCAKRKA